MHMKEKIGIIAGEGVLPIEICKSLMESHAEIAICSFRESNEFFEISRIPHLAASFGKVQQIIDFFKKHEIQKIILAGSLKRPDFSSLKIDFTGTKLLAEIMKAKLIGDDNLLKIVIQFLEKQNFKIVASQEICPELLMPSGVLTIKKPTEKNLADIKIATDFLKATSSFDVGQAVIISSGVIIAVEAAEGTDEMIKRSKIFCHKQKSAILVKTLKINQELRVDLPSIGLQTAVHAKDIGLEGVAISSFGAFLLEKENLIKFANENGLFIVGI